MKVALEQRPDRDFEVPEGIVFARVDPARGGLSSPGELRPFAEGQLPRAASGPAISATEQRRMERLDLLSSRSSSLGRRCTYSPAGQASATSPKWTRARFDTASSGGVATGPSGEGRRRSEAAGRAGGRGAASAAPRAPGGAGDDVTGWRRPEPPRPRARRPLREPGCERAAVWARGPAGRARRARGARARAAARTTPTTRALAQLADATDLGAVGPSAASCASRARAGSPPRRRCAGRAATRSPCSSLGGGRRARRRASARARSRRSAPRPRGSPARSARPRRSRGSRGSTPTCAASTGSPSLGELVAEIVHEIRNPLVSVKTFLQLLPERASRARVPRPLPRGRGRRAAPHRAAPRPRARARAPGRAAARQRPRRARRRRASPSCSSSRTAPPISASPSQLAPGDPALRVALSDDALRQVVLNLVLNALDATPRGGHVRLVYTRRRRDAELRVEDEGPGIPEALRERIFEPFFSTKPDAPGGLGLAITRRIVEDAGGTITRRGPRAGGSRFRVRLPSEGTDVSKAGKCSPRASASLRTRSVASDLREPVADDARELGEARHEEVVGLGDDVEAGVRDVLELARRGRRRREASRRSPVTTRSGRRELGERARLEQRGRRRDEEDAADARVEERGAQRGRGAERVAARDDLARARSRRGARARRRSRRRRRAGRRSARRCSRRRRAS